MNTFKTILFGIGLSIYQYSSYAQCTLSSSPVPTNVSCDNTPGQIDLGLTGVTGYQYVTSEPEVIDTLFGAEVINFSSEYGLGWYATSILGEPDIYPGYADVAGAWVGALPDTDAWIEVGFEKVMKVTGVNIYETYTPGAIDTVYLRDFNSGTWNIVWYDTTGVSPGPEVATIFNLSIAKTSYYVDAIRINVDGANVPGWNEIDAVSLIGQSFDTSAVLTGLMPGTYTYRISDDGGCEVTTSTIQIDKDGLQITGQTINGGGIQCAEDANGSVTFTTANSTGQVYTAVEYKQWGGQVLGFSSEYGFGYDAIEILGEPDIYPNYGDSEGSWTSDVTGNREWVVVGFDTPQPVSSIDIYETYHPGSIDTVYVRNATDGTWNTVWSGTAHLGTQEATIFNVTIPQTTYNVDAVRFAVGDAIGGFFKEYDAISISYVDTVIGTTATGLSVNTYNITVFDDANCSESISFTMPGPEPIEVLKSDPGIITCYGDSLSFEVDLLGGTGQLTIDWFGADITSVKDTSYYPFMVTDENGCVLSDSMRYTAQFLPESELLAIVVVTDATCNGADGKAAITVQGGYSQSINYSVNYYGADTSALTEGVYPYVVTDGPGCTFVDSFIVNNVGGPVVVPNVTDVSTCNGDNTGSATFLVSGGTPSYSRNVFGVDTTALSAGVYTVEVTDAANCVTNEFYEVFEPDSISMSTVAVGSVFNDGEITVTSSGGTGNHTYSIDNTNFQSSNLFNSLAAATYTVTTRDDNGCEVSEDVLVDQWLGFGDEGNFTVSVYPNPSTGIVNISIDETAGSYSVIIINELGVEVYSTPELSGALQLELNAGVYFATVSSLTGSRTVRIIIN